MYDGADGILIEVNIAIYYLVFAEWVQGGSHTTTNNYIRLVTEYKINARRIFVFFQNLLVHV